MATLNDDPSLSVMPPTEITSGIFTSSTIPETDYSVYNPVGNYAKGAFVISTTTHRIYQSQLDNNQGHDPTDINNRVGAIIYWTDVGPTNKWAMYDDETSTQTVSPSGVPLTTVLQPGFFDTIYYGGLEAETISLIIEDTISNEVLFTYSGSLEGSQPDDYWEHFYSPFVPLRDLLLTNLTPVNSAKLTTTLTSGGVSKVGIHAVGMIQKLGETQYGASASPKTYSSLKTDDYGRTTIKRRAKAKNMAATSELEVEEADRVLFAVTELLDIPAVWIGTNIPVYGGLRCFGLGSGKMSYPSYGRAQFDLTVQGMI